MVSIAPPPVDPGRTTRPGWRQELDGIQPPSPFARVKEAVGRPRVLVGLGTAVAIFYLALGPLLYLLWGTFTDENGVSLGGFERAYTGDRIGSLISNSLVFAIGSAVLSMVLGTALAFFNVRTAVPFKGLFFAASIIPLIIPGILYTISWIFLASPQIGMINAALQPLFGPGTFNIFSLKGMIFVQGLHSTPIAFLFMVAAFRSTDPSLEESALMSGATRLQTFFRITLPLVRPALIASGLIMVVQALESFEVPALLGLQNGTYVFTSKIYQLLKAYPTDFAAAGAFACGLLVVAALGVYISNRVARQTAGTISGKGFRPRPMDLGAWRPVIGAGILFYFALSVVAPLVVLVYMSLLPYYQRPSAAAFEAMTFENYTKVFDQPLVVTALKNSLLLGFGAATIVMALAAVASWVVVRSGLPGRQVLDHVAFAPLAIPGLVLGLGIAFVYLRSPLPIYGTLLILLIGYCTRYLPYGMRYAVGGIHSISKELEESAEVSGAGWWSTFRRVMLPLLAPSLLAGWVYIFVVSFRELSSSILLYSPGHEVLSILIFELYVNARFNELAALGVIMVVILAVLVAVAYRIGVGFGLRDDD